MKFDFAIGNPPYQEETADISSTNGQAPRKNVFHYFQMEADKIAQEGTVLIYPGGRWIHQSGKGLKQFGKDLINDVTLSQIEYYPDSRDVFGSAAELTDGITIVSKKHNKQTEGFEYSFIQGANKETVHADNPGEELMPLDPKDLKIIHKVKAFVEKNDIGFLHNKILPRSLFNIESDFVQKNPNSVRIYTSDKDIDYSKEIKLLTNDKAGAAGRSMWFVANKELITTNQAYISEWQVAVSSAHAGGQSGRSNQIEIIDNHSAFGRARVALRSFTTEKEAQNFFNYANAYLIKFTFLMTAEALSSLAKLVPDVDNYSDSNSLIDFSQNIDNQLFKMVELTEEEISYIKNRVDGNR